MGRQIQVRMNINKCSSVILLVILFAFSLSCHKDVINNIENENDIIAADKLYSELPINEQVNIFNKVINYYQFTGSKKALNFIEKRFNIRDRVAVEAVTTAKRVGINIPLSE